MQNKIGKIYGDMQIAVYKTLEKNGAMSIKELSENLGVDTRKTVSDMADNTVLSATLRDGEFYYQIISPEKLARLLSNIKIADY